MTNEFNLSQKEIQDLQDHGFATVNGVTLSTLESMQNEFQKINDVRKMLLLSRVGVLVNSYVDEKKDVLRVEANKFDGSGAIVKICKYSLYQQAFETRAGE